MAQGTRKAYRALPWICATCFFVFGVVDAQDVHRGQSKLCNCGYQGGFCHHHGADEAVKADVMQRHQLAR